MRTCPQIANLIMNCDYAKAAKEALKKQRKSELQDFVRRVTAAKFNVTLFGFGIALGIGHN